jgi:hypothetical protein
VQKSVAAMLVVAAVGLVALATAAAEPRERFVAYAVDYWEPGQVWRADLDGSGARQLTIGETADVSPDGAHIAFIRNSRLYVMNADGSGVTPLHDFGNTNSGRDAPSVMWAPDSRRIAVQDAEGPIWLVDTRGPTTRRLVHRRHNCCLGLTGFAPRGCELVYEVEDVTPRSDPFRVRVVHCDGSHGRTVGSTFGGAVWGNAGIAVMTRAGLRIIRPDGTLLRLPGARGTPTAFSSDGRMLLAQDADTMSVIEVATGRIRTLKTPAVSGAPGTLALSHDGSSILALLGCFQDRSPSGTLEVISVDSGAARVIVAEDPDHARYGPCRASWNA